MNQNLMNVEDYNVKDTLSTIDGSLMPVFTAMGAWGSTNR